MAKWLVATAAVLAIALAGLLWLLDRPSDAHRTATASGSEDLKSVAIASSSRPETRTPAEPPEPTEREDSREASDTPAPERLDPKSDEFAERLDAAVPNKLMEALAPCYEGGLNPNLKLKVSYRLQVADGQLSTAAISVVESTLDNEQLEQCMLSAIERASWRDDAMPDWTERQELTIRLRALKKFSPKNLDTDDEEPE